MALQWSPPFPNMVFSFFSFFTLDKQDPKDQDDDNIVTIKTLTAMDFGVWEYWEITSVRQVPPSEIICSQFKGRYLVKSVCISAVACREEAVEMVTNSDYYIILQSYSSMYTHFLCWSFWCFLIALHIMFKYIHQIMEQSLNTYVRWFMVVGFSDLFLMLLLYFPAFLIQNSLKAGILPSVHQHSILSNKQGHISTFFCNGKESSIF